MGTINRIPGGVSETGHGLKMVYKYTCLAMALIFATVGLLFLFLSNGVLSFFNDISCLFGMVMSPLPGNGFYLILAVSYMYLVALIAFLIYLQPDNLLLSRLLIHGKFASSVLSFYMFLQDAPCLIYLTNGIIDGLIGFVLLVFFLRIKKILV